MTVHRRPLGDVLDEWERSDRRTRVRELLLERDGIDPDEVILTPERASAMGMTSTVCFPLGNLAPQGSVVKSTAIAAELDRRRRRLPPQRAGARVHERARRDRGDQGGRASPRATCSA